MPRSFLIALIFFFPLTLQSMTATRGFDREYPVDCSPPHSCAIDLIEFDDAEFKCDDPNINYLFPELEEYNFYENGLCEENFNLFNS